MKTFDNSQFYLDYPFCVASSYSTSHSIFPWPHTRVSKCVSINLYLCSWCFLCKKCFSLSDLPLGILFLSPRLSVSITSRKPFPSFIANLFMLSAVSPQESSTSQMRKRLRSLSVKRGSTASRADCAILSSMCSGRRTKQFIISFSSAVIKNVTEEI